MNEDTPNMDSDAWCLEILLSKNEILLSKNDTKKVESDLSYRYPRSYE